MIYDTFFTAIGERTGRPYERLWIEDSFGRLSRNGFVANSAFNVTPRPGVGLVLTPSVLGEYSITPRRGASVISLEQRGLSDLVRSREVRVRLCVKSIVVMPCLRAFHVARPTTGVWTIAGMTLTTPEGATDIGTPSPAGMRSTPARLDVQLSEANIVFATEIIGNATPAEVTLSGDPLMVVVGGQFLAAAGYGPTPDGIWRR